MPIHKQNMVFAVNDGDTPTGKKQTEQKYLRDCGDTRGRLSTCCQGIFTHLDLSFQRRCGQNIESNRVIHCLPLFSLGYKSTVVTMEWGVKEKVTDGCAYSRNGMARSEAPVYWSVDRSKVRS